MLRKYPQREIHARINAKPLHQKLVSFRNPKENSSPLKNNEDSPTQPPQRIKDRARQSSKLAPGHPRVSRVMDLRYRYNLVSSAHSGVHRAHQARVTYLAHTETQPTRFRVAYTCARGRLRNRVEKKKIARANKLSHSPDSLARGLFSLLSLYSIYTLVCASFVCVCVGMDAMVMKSCWFKCAQHVGLLICRAKVRAKIRWNSRPSCQWRR